MDNIEVIGLKKLNKDICIQLKSATNITKYIYFLQQVRHINMFKTVRVTLYFWIS